MFGRQKGGTTDVKKSTVKFLDPKKDVPTRLKHLKLILDSVELSEAKGLFATNYSHIYHLVYEGVVYAEGALKQKGVHRAQREELESVLHLLERIIVLLPDLLHCRWQLHSMARLMAKLNHPGNSMALRKQGIRLFLMWYQCLGTSAPPYVHLMFASLVPGLPGVHAWPPPPLGGLGGGDGSSGSCGVTSLEITPVLPSTLGERLPEDVTSYFLELLLDSMVSQAPKILWNDGQIMWSRSIEFLYERFKEFYLPVIFPNFEVKTDIYKPTLELPVPRKTVELSNNVVTACQVVFVRWIANYAHSVYRSTDCAVPGQMSSYASSTSRSPNPQDHHHLQHHDTKSTSSQPSSLGDRDSITSYSSLINNDVDANVLAKDVILGSRSNINFLHEVFRRALLMSFVQTPAMRRVICVYKDWIQMNVPELPVFMLEPEEDSSEDPSDLKNRLRTDSYYGAVIGMGLAGSNNNREDYANVSSHLRAGAQNVLQLFFCNSAAVFLLFQPPPKHDLGLAVLEEQVDICKRVLNIYRYAVMNTRMSSNTWEQLLVVLLRITSKVLDPKEKKESFEGSSTSTSSLKNPESSLASKLAGALFQTLIVSWVKASLNVPLSVELWDKFQSVLSNLTFCDDLVSEWSKTMETLTRVLTRHVYNLDLGNLPLDRLSEQKTKKGRRGQGQGQSLNQQSPSSSNNNPSSSSTSVPVSHPSPQERGRPPGGITSTSSDRKSLILLSQSTPTPYRRNNKMKRSLSDGNLFHSPSPRKDNHNNIHETSTDSEDMQGSHSLGYPANTISPSPFSVINLRTPKIRRRRKKSRSMDSLRTLKIATHFGHIGQPGALNPEWAEISSSTASLEHEQEDSASTINIDDMNTNHSLESSGGPVPSTSGGKNELRGVIAGGSIKGWLPSVAAILWRRMIGILGNPNDFPTPKTYSHFFQILTEIWLTLKKVRMNQGVSQDNVTTPRPSELCPPLTIFAGWCFQALEESEDGGGYKGEEFRKGKVLACGLLCDIVITNQDIPFPQEFLTKFYATLHRIITNAGKQKEMINEIIRRCGYKFISKMLPGFSLLLLSLSQGSHTVLSSDDLKKSPRMEAATILGSVLTLTDVCRELPILKPNSLQFQPMMPHPTSDVVLQCLLQFGKTEQTSYARSVCLQSLTIHLCKELLNIRMQNPNPGRLEKEKLTRVTTIVKVLLASVKVANRSVALVAADLLLLLSEFAEEISKYFPNLVGKIILGLKCSLQQALPLKNSSWKTGKPVEMEKRLLISLLLTIGEWCIKLPPPTILGTENSKGHPLLSSVFEVLRMGMKGFQVPATSGSDQFSEDFKSLEDFEPSIPFDDLMNSGDPSGGKGDKVNPQLSADTLYSPSQDLETVRLSSRTVLLHLLTQLGHFPMGTSGCAPRCGSVVTENDDVGGGEMMIHDEISSFIFSLPNLQMFSFNKNTLLSIVEVPGGMMSENSNCPGGGRSSEGLDTSRSQVRLILRDLSGKACWDASYLSCPPRMVEKKNDEVQGSVYSHHQHQHLHHQGEELLFSAITGNFLLAQVGPRLTMRRRQGGVLPTFENSADDMDNLDDLLSYIGTTSPECLQRVGEPLSTPWVPPSSITQENEDDVVGAVVNQRNSEFEFLMKFESDLTMKGMPASLHSSSIPQGHQTEQESYSSLISTSTSGFSSSCSTPSSSFILSRRLFSHLGLTGWDKRDTIDILQKDERLLREIKHLDNQRCRETHKIAVIYVAEGQEDKGSILSNTGGSELYEDFVAGLGWEVDLETHSGFMGGLQRNKTTGETAPYYATSFTETIFHVSTRMPSDTEESLLQKTRHLGNDEVHIVWSEHYRDYRRDIIPTEFCDVLIVIYPLRFGLFRVQISRKPEVPYFGPLYNEAIVERDVLPTLVRATAINASRAKRSSLQYFQHHFEERAKSLSTIVQNHKSRTTFESFASQAFSPVLPNTTTNNSNNRASLASFPSRSNTSSTASTSTVVNPSPLSSALLLDSAGSSNNHHRRSYEVPFTPPEARSGRSSGLDSGSRGASPIPSVNNKTRVGLLNLNMSSNKQPKSPLLPSKNTVSGSSYSNP